MAFIRETLELCEKSLLVRASALLAKLRHLTLKDLVQDQKERSVSTGTRLILWEEQKQAGRGSQPWLWNLHPKMTLLLKD